jgi:hypothetical protein
MAMLLSGLAVGAATAANAELMIINAHLQRA